MRLLQRCSLVLLLLAAAHSAGQTGTPTSSDEYLALGIRQYADGDFEVAVFTLDSVVRRLAAVPSQNASLIQAYLYLGASYIGLDAEEPARGKFREALRLDPQLRVSAEGFPPRVVRVFDGEVVRLGATKGRRRGKWLLALGGVGAAAAVAVAAGGEPANRPPSATINVSPDGKALVPVTLMTVTASADDLDGDPLAFRWQFGDGGIADGITASHVYRTTGSFTVTLTVDDGRGGTVGRFTTISAETLSGPWGVGTQGAWTCEQVETLLQCRKNVVPLDLRGTVRIQGTLSNPRRLNGFNVFRFEDGGELQRPCPGGEVSNDLRRILCDTITLMR